MPPRAAKPCNAFGCRALVHDGGARCERHRLAPWAAREGAAKRIKGTTLQNARARLFRRNPLCVECEKAGRVTLATQRDHIVPMFEGGRDDDSNTQGLCVPCHEAKSLAERLRARCG